MCREDTASGRRKVAFALSQLRPDGVRALDFAHGSIRCREYACAGAGFRPTGGRPCLRALCALGPVPSPASFRFRQYRECAASAPAPPHVVLGLDPGTHGEMEPCRKTAAMRHRTPNLEPPITHPLHHPPKRQNPRTIPSRGFALPLKGCVLETVSSGRLFHFLGSVDRIPQDVPASPHGFDMMIAAGRRRQLLAQLADEHIDDLQFRLVHAAVEMVEEHLLGEGRALAQGTAARASGIPCR